MSAQRDLLEIGVLTDGTQLGPKSMISDRECGALRLLAADGWHPEDLGFVFGFQSTNSIRYHARGGCSCETVVEPVPEYRKPPDDGDEDEDPEDE